MSTTPVAHRFSGASGDIGAAIAKIWATMDGILSAPMLAPQTLPLHFAAVIDTGGSAEAMARSTRPALSTRSSRPSTKTTVA